MVKDLIQIDHAQWNDTVNNQILFDFVPYVRQRSRFLVFKLIFDF